MISSIRQKYPQYKDMSDQQLADALHQKYYSDMPKDTFYSKIGLTRAAPVAPTVQRPATFGEALKDIGTTLAGEASGLVKNVMPWDASKMDPASYQQVLKKYPQYAVPEGLPAGVTQDPHFKMGEQISGPLMTLGTMIGGGAEPILKGLTKTAPVLEDVEGMAQTIRNKLWPHSINDASKSLATDFRDSYQKVAKESSQNYKPLLDKYGDKMMYSSTLPKKSYFNLDDRVLENMSGGAKKLAKRFEDNPTFRNAHDFQSELGKFSASRRTWNASPADRMLADDATATRDSLKNDIMMYLKRADPEGKAPSQYQYATDFHRERVAPFYQSNQLAKIAKGKIINPKNIPSILKNPEPSTLKVIDALPPEAHDKILIHKLGTVGASKNAESTLNAFRKLDEQGLRDYVSPRLDSQMGELAAGLRGNKIIKAAREKNIKKLKYLIPAAKWIGIGGLIGGGEEGARHLFGE